MARNQFWMQTTCAVDMREASILIKFAFNCNRVNTIISLFIQLTTFQVRLMTFVISCVVLIKPFIFKEQAMISPNRCPLPLLNQACMCARSRSSVGCSRDHIPGLQRGTHLSTEGQRFTSSLSPQGFHPHSVPTVNTVHIFSACASHSLFELDACWWQNLSREAGWEAEEWKRFVDPSLAHTQNLCSHLAGWITLLCWPLLLLN